MGKSILIIGGTYFAGRVFAILAAREGHTLTFLNRGRYSMKTLHESVREIHADRTDIESLKNCALSGSFDAVVDFCGYEPGDVRKICENLEITTKQYIFFSTADVYARQSGNPGEPDVRSESSPLVEEEPLDPAGLYIYKKMLLEEELKDAAKRFGFACTILRPAFIYGPYNYAPREAVYIRSLLRGEPIYYPEDATGSFQMVYVKDVALAILACIEKEAAENRAYTLSAPEVLNYESFLSLLERVSEIKANGIIRVTVQEAVSSELPLPFPLTKEEDELFDGSLAVRELGISYTPIEEGMKKTFEAFRPVFVQ